MALDYVLWELTQKCNLRCIHCRADASPEKKEEKLIEGEYAFQLIDELAKMGNPILVLTGGEPLLRNDLLLITKYATSKGLSVRIQSNGLLLTDKIAEQLKNAGIISFGIGLDGPNAGIHDRIRVKRGAFQKAIEAINILKSKEIKVHVEFTLTKINYDKVWETLDLIESLEVDTFLARAAIFAGRTTVKNSIFRISKAKYKKFLERLSREKKDRKIILNSQDPLYHLVDNYSIERLRKYGDIYSGQVLSGCTLGLNMVHIHSNGLVGLCTFLPNLTIGNIFEKSLSQIWSERTANQEVTRLIKRDYEGLCKKCEDRFICGGCRARALSLKNNLFESDQYCWKHFKMVDS